MVTPFLVAGSPTSSCLHNQHNLLALNHSALLLGFRGRAERFLINETRGSCRILLASRERKEHISQCRAKYSCTVLLHPILLLASAYLASPRGMEKFHAFLLLQRFLPGIQSHKGSGRKLVTGPRLPLQCNFSQNVVLQSWPRVGWYSTVLEHKGSDPRVHPHSG